MTKFNWETWAPMFGSWAEKIKPFFLEGGFDEIYGELKKQSGEGIRIVPESEDVFRCFRETKYKDLLCVIMGLCPYHSIINGTCVADGLLMSCGKTHKLQPSLEKFYDSMEEYIDVEDRPIVREPDLTYLARQGVLMFNAALTTISGQAKAHQDLWMPFTKYIMEDVIGPSGVPVVFLGQEASTFSSFLSPMQHSLELHHPAYASYRKEKWDSRGMFKWVNRIVRDMNGVEILWNLCSVPF